MSLGHRVGCRGRIASLAALLLLAGAVRAGAKDVTLSSGVVVSVSGGTADAVAASTTPFVLVLPRHEADVPFIALAAGTTVAGEVRGTAWYALWTAAGTTPLETVARLKRDARVLDATVDTVFGTPEGGGSTIPAFGDDPVSAVATQDAMMQIGAPRARRRTTGSGVLVAVIDTGVATGHPLFEGRVASGGWDFVDDDPDPSDTGNGLDDDGDGRVDEGVGHGTFVASLVLAVAPDAGILPLRALGSDGVGTVTRIAAAIDYAVSHGARVVNLSFGAPQASPVLQQSVQSALASGVAVLACAGNDGFAYVDHPASESGALGVAAVDESDVRAPFSQYGDRVGLCGPGVELIGAHPSSPSGTARWSGTSFSTALAAGGVALVAQQRPRWKASDLVRRLRETCRSIAEQNPDTASRLGSGRLDLEAATRP